MAIILPGGSELAVSTSVGLKQIRQLFIRTSGRYDLENEDGSDNGANWYIIAGQRFLDRQLTESSAQQRYYSKVKQGDNFVQFSKCRALMSAYLINDDEGRILLRRKSYPQLRAAFPKPPNGEGLGQPGYYAATIYKAVHTELDELKDVSMDYLDIIVNEPKDFNAIILAPAADKDYIIELNGLFYSHELTEDSSKSFWTESHPELLVRAAMLTLESFYRNTAGWKDAYQALLMDLKDIDMDYVLDESEHLEHLGEHR